MGRGIDLMVTALREVWRIGVGRQGMKGGMCVNSVSESEGEGEGEGVEEEGGVVGVEGVGGQRVLRRGRGGVNVGGGLEGGRVWVEVLGRDVGGKGKLSMRRVKLSLRRAELRFWSAAVWGVVEKEALSSSSSSSLSRNLKRLSSGELKR